MCNLTKCFSFVNRLSCLCMRQIVVKISVIETFEPLSLSLFFNTIFTFSIGKMGFLSFMIIKKQFFFNELMMLQYIKKVLRIRIRIVDCDFLSLWIRIWILIFLASGIGYLTLSEYLYLSYFPCPSYFQTLFFHCSGNGLYPQSSTLYIYYIYNHRACMCSISLLPKPAIRVYPI